MKRFLNIILFLPILTCIGSPVRSALGAKGILYTGGHVLPYDAEVEYLESTGTQWIDTGVIPTASTSVLCAFSLTKIPSDTYAGAFGAGTMTQPPSGFILFLNNTVNVQARTGHYSGPNIVSTYQVAKDFEYIVTMAMNSLMINGLSFVPSRDNTWIDIQTNLYIFSVDDAHETRRRIASKFRYFRVFDSGLLVRDLIPVRFTNDQGVSEGAMYDRANPTVGMNPDGSSRTDGLYRNRGSGSFIIGPDK